LEIVINGEPRQVDGDVTLAALLEQLEMKPRYLAVERNRELVPRGRHAECVLQPGDALEIVTLVGGG
jgi:sulfur carrier protein